MKPNRPAQIAVLFGIALLLLSTLSCALPFTAPAEPTVDAFATAYATLTRQAASPEAHSPEFTPTQPKETPRPVPTGQPLPASLQVLYLSTEGQITLTDLSGTESAVLTTVSTQTAPGDEPNVWLQFHLSSPLQVSPAGNPLLLPDGSGGWLIYDLAKRSLLKTFNPNDAIRSPTWAPAGIHPEWAIMPVQPRRRYD